MMVRFIRINSEIFAQFPALPSSSGCACLSVTQFLINKMEMALSHRY